MRIGIMDADLLCGSRHSFPNLACMKLSGFHKSRGDDTELVLDPGMVTAYDRIYVSKVFTDTVVPEEVLCLDNVVCGGTGFFYDKAEPLPEEAEHHMPDYGLYQEFIQNRVHSGKAKASDRFYTDYSIGFLTRGCFRKCAFCVNRNSTKSIRASPLKEFMDVGRKKLCFLDDNFLACAEWERILDEVLESGKRFQFRQGLDLRIMQRRQMDRLFSGKLDGDVIFAFDDIADRETIERKLSLLRETVKVKNGLKLYVLCGYDRKGGWGSGFWAEDIRNTLERVKILMRFGCLAYIMRYEKCWQSPYRGMYTVISRWCNQPAQYRKKSLREFCISQGENSSSVRYLEEFEAGHPGLSGYFDMKYGEECHV